MVVSFSRIGVLHLQRLQTPSNQLQENSEYPLRDHVRRLLQEISEDLCKAIGESDEVSDKLNELRDAGYSLNLMLDCRLADDSGEDEVTDGDQVRSGLMPTASESQPTADFRINANDLAFLRSVGIDPTRPGRSKGSSKANGMLSSQGQADG